MAPKPAAPTAMPAMAPVFRLVDFESELRELEVEVSSGKDDV